MLRFDGQVSYCNSVPDLRGRYIQKRYPQR